MTQGIITIRKGRSKPIVNRHPWVFSGAIAKAENADDGAIVTVIDHNGQFLGRGYWNSQSQIQVRIMTWRDETIDEQWWRERLQRAITMRYPSVQYHMGNRIVNAENDYLPGLIVDRYADYLVLQALTLYIDQHKQWLAQLLVELFEQAGMPIKGVYERSDVDVRGREGLSEERGVLWGDEPPEIVNFRNHNLFRFVDIRNGHKTGYYLDQVDNQMLMAQLTTRPDLDLETASVLNTFCFSGGFGLMSAVPVTNVDSSEDALKLAQHTYESNGWDMRDVSFVQADVFEYLRDAVKRGEQHDVIVLDPPKFAHSKRQIKRASRGYKDINLNAFKLVRAGGYLLTFSCSGAVDRDLFQKIVFGALADSGRQGQIVQHLGAGPDHPVALTFPEGEYLKGLLVRVY
jgi:23S rRNA (cytosine1962-C5)-methyltransferase